MKGNIGKKQKLNLFFALLFITAIFGVQFAEAVRPEDEVLPASWQTTSNGAYQELSSNKGVIIHVKYG